MRVKWPLVLCHDDGHEEPVTDVITLNKHPQRIEHLGLTMAESKHLLSTLQRHLLQQQVHTFLHTSSTCQDCNTPLTLKAHGSRSFRTLFGTFKLPSPRLELCPCKRPEPSSCRPLSALLTDSVAPELHIPPNLVVAPRASHNTLDLSMRYLHHVFLRANGI